MPYIKKDARQGIETVSPCEDTGELNYLIMQAINEYLKYNGVSYKKLNDCMGVLSCVQQELYRRIAEPYEDKKKNANGDVFSSSVLMQIEDKGE